MEASTKTDTEDVIHSTSEDITQILDKAESSIRTLSIDPNLPPKLSGLVSKKTAPTQHKTPVIQKEEKPARKASEGQQYKEEATQRDSENHIVYPPIEAANTPSSSDVCLLSTHSNTELDWVITTNPQKKQEIKILEPCHVKSKDVKNEWIIQTQHDNDQAHTSARSPEQRKRSQPESEKELEKQVQKFVKEQEKSGRRDPVVGKKQTPKKSEQQGQKPVLDVAKAKDKSGRRDSDSLVKLSPNKGALIQKDALLKDLSKEFFDYGRDDQEVVPTSVTSEVSTRPMSKSHNRLSITKSHRRVDEKPTERAISGSEVMTAPSRRRMHKRTRSDVDVRTAVESRSITLFKSMRLRARRKKRIKRHDESTAIRPTEEVLNDDHTVELAPLKSPISIDSIRRLTRNGDQINFRQVLRIYGSGAVEEPYDTIPRRSSVLAARGMATAKYGTNMIEIAVQNTDIQPNKRGRVGSWVFAPSKDVHKVPIVFGKTKIANEKGPAPFCISISAPFFVTCHQEQIASSRKGERIRECIEVRQCSGSGMPFYEMKSLDPTPHPLFSEHVYLGVGVIRVDRSSHIPSDEKLTSFFAAEINTTSLRQYRIPIPWRKEGVNNCSIPRPVPIKDIRTTVRQHSSVQPLATQKEGETTQDGKSKSKKKKKKKNGRRRLPPRSADVTGCNIVPAQNEDDGYQLTVKRSRLRLASGSSVSKKVDSETDISKVSAKNAFAPPARKMRESKTVAGSGVIASSRQSSPVQHSDREIIKGSKESELRRASRAPRVLARNTKEPSTLYPPKSAKDQRSSSKSTKGTNNAAGQKPNVVHLKASPKKSMSRTQTSSSGSMSELGVVSERAMNDKVTATALAPQILRLREPIRIKSSSTSKNLQNRSPFWNKVSAKGSQKQPLGNGKVNSEQRHLSSLKTATSFPKNNHFVIHKEVKEINDSTTDVNLQSSGKVKENPIRVATFTKYMPQKNIVSAADARGK